MKEMSAMKIVSLHFAANRRITKSVLIVLMMFGFLQPLLFPASVQAEEKVWTGGTGWWDEEANWNPSGQPQTGDDVFLTQTDTIDRNVHYRNTLSPDATLESLTISATGTGNMTLNLGQDRLEVNNELVGHGIGVYGEDPYLFGTGQITQTSGEHFVNGTLQLGYSIGKGAYNMIEGNLSAQRFILGSGNEGTGILNMIGGNLSAELISVADDMGFGTINQSGGTITAQVLGLASEHGSVGIYNLSGGKVTTNETSSTGYGTLYFNQSGGTHVTGRLGLGYDGDVGYNLSGGTLEADSVTFGRDSGHHEFTQTGGSFIVNDRLYLGNVGDFNLVDGTLEANNVTLNGDDHTIFTQTGGTHIVHDTLTIGRSNGEYNLSGGTLTSLNLINDDEFNYSGGDLNADITNYGTANLSGDGTRAVNGDVINNGTWESTNTTVSYDGSFINNNTFNSENSVQYFEELIIGNNGAMTGRGDAPWFVKEAFSGLSILDDTVANILGEQDFSVYYNPLTTSNEYLGGLDYYLTGGGMLAALDGIVSTDKYFIADHLTLSDTFNFDYWWEMGNEPTDPNLDILFFYDNEWLSFGGLLPNFDGSSSDWETFSMYVPEWARGLETQIRFFLADAGQKTDPTVYLRNISSNPIPEPSTILLVGVGLAGIAGIRRKLKSNISA